MFTATYVYKLKECGTDTIFVCKEVAGKNLGKLVQYKCIYDNTSSNIIYMRTGSDYFLADYLNKTKNYFLDSDNYEVIGRLGVNYFPSIDTEENLLVTKLKLGEIYGHNKTV